jgi:predicted DNA-binding transcriptional regulator YafY
VRRLVERLRAEGLDVIDDFEDGLRVYRLPPEAWTIPDAPIEGLTEREALALVVAASAARAALAPSPLAEPLAGAFDKLIDRLGPHVETFEPDDERAHWHFALAAQAHFDPEVLDVLRAAMARRQSVRVTYHTGGTNTVTTGRKLDPYCLAVRGSSWLCAAYCHMREGVRDFALARIEAIELCDPTREARPYYDIPAGFDPQAHFAGRFRAMGEGARHVVRLVADPATRPFFESKRYHPSQVIEPGADAEGRFVVRYEVVGLKEIAAFARSWGAKVEVAEPPALVAEMRATAEALHARYAAGIEDRR